MAENVLIYGYEAIGRGAVDAGCLNFFGYPITPQTEITEFFSREAFDTGMGLAASNRDQPLLESSDPFYRFQDNLFGSVGPVPRTGRLGTGPYTPNSFS